MSDTAQNLDLSLDTSQASATNASQSNARVPSLKIIPPARHYDLTTYAGLALSLALILAAMIYGGQAQAFFNWPSVFIVVFGTLAVTAISYSGKELRNSMSVLGSSFVKDVRKPSLIARELLDLAVIVRIKGILAIGQYDSLLKRDPFLYHGAMFVGDNYTPDEVKRILTNDIESLIERHRRGASIARRAGEVAPAMGLIGTLVGLVQMLNQLDDPSKIGGAMALALLTTFYGAIMSTVVFLPMAAKLERNSSDDVMIKELIMTAMVSMARKDHPRKLEHELNMRLPPDERVRYFTQ